MEPRGRGRVGRHLDFDPVPPGEPDIVPAFRGHPDEDAGHPTREVHFVRLERVEIDGCSDEPTQIRRQWRSETGLDPPEDAVRPPTQPARLAPDRGEEYGGAPRVMPGHER